MMISVNDELPTEVGAYWVVCADNEELFLARCYICPEYGNLTWTDSYGEDFPLEITHWMKPPYYGEK